MLFICRFGPWTKIKLSLSQTNKGMSNLSSNNNSVNATNKPVKILFFCFSVIYIKFWYINTRFKGWKVKTLHWKLKDFCPSVNYWMLWWCSNIADGQSKNNSLLPWWPLPPLPPPLSPDYNFFFPFPCRKIPISSSYVISAYPKLHH